MGSTPAQRARREKINAERIAAGKRPIRRRGAPGRAAVAPKDYEAYIRSAAWRAVRERFIASKIKKVCMGCGKPWGKGDHLHHRTYKNLGNERLMDLVPLCQPCHTRVHQLYDSDPNARKIGLWYVTRKIIRKQEREIGREYQRPQREQRVRNREVERQRREEQAARTEVAG
jgi:hypothetical protein